jgi:transposase
MSKTFRPWDVEQRWLLPPSVQELVPAGHVAHFVRETVREQLDLGAVFAAYREERGYPPYHPAMMVALLLYAYSRGLYSSRKIAQACEERLDFMAVTAMNRPDHRTIATFRRRHLRALGDLFVQVLKLCRAAGLVKLGHVALDGTKVQANASRHKAMSYKRLREAEQKLAAEVAAWFTRAEASDAAEDREHGPDRRGDEMPDWVVDKTARLERIRAAKAALEAEAAAPLGDADDDGPGPSSGMMRSGRPQRAAEGGPPERAQRNFTDPDSRIQPTRDGVIAGYNALIAVDGAHQIIVAQHLQTNAADRGGLAPLLSACVRHCAAIRRRSRPMRASVTKPISPSSPGTGSALISPPAAPGIMGGVRAANDAFAKARGSRPWRPSSGVPAGAAAIACASRSSSPSSVRSSTPEPSVSSCCEASPRSAASGR